MRLTAAVRSFSHSVSHSSIDFGSAAAPDVVLPPADPAAVVAAPAAAVVAVLDSSSPSSPPHAAATSAMPSAVAPARRRQVPYMSPPCVGGASGPPPTGGGLAVELTGSRPRALLIRGTGGALCSGRAHAVPRQHNSMDNLLADALPRDGRKCVLRHRVARCPSARCPLLARRARSASCAPTGPSQVPSADGRDDGHRSGLLRAGRLPGGRPARSLRPGPDEGAGPLGRAPAAVTATGR